MRTLSNKITAQVGETITLEGWVNVRRDHGKIIFIDLRDRSGLVQLVFVPSVKEVYALAETLRPEWVIKVEGVVAKRPANMVNDKISTGNHEIQVISLEVLNSSEAAPFPLDTDGGEIDEEVRLKYRYLDLRRPRLNKNLRLRSALIDKARQFFLKNDFIEIETPMLTKSTPEGSRDFVVPSRLHQGKFFALPQSPQQYKQMLMTAGFERYFQIARAVRDEDLRADRGFEHTQIDLEMSFVDREEVMALNEAMMIDVCESLGYKIKEKPFPIFSYEEAMKKFGADKFDLRSDEEKKNNILAFAWVVDFPFFEKNKEGKWTFTHNPFSHPRSEHLDSLLEGKRIDKILASQYDLVCNGHEVGGGSIRAHRPEILKAVFKILGHSNEAIEEQFGHMLRAFSYGTPPHGGIAFGVERLMMILTGETHLREVQAFPQTSSGRTSVMDAPSELTKDQLDELSLTIKKSKK